MRCPAERRLKGHVGVVSDKYFVLAGMNMERAALQLEVRHADLA